MTRRVAAFAEQVEGAGGGRRRSAWIETMSSQDEIRAAAEGAAAPACPSSPP